MIIITGAGGFIGSVLAATLNSSGFTELVLVDSFGSGEKWRNIAKRDFAEIVPIDGFWQWLGGVREPVQAVLHLGAISSTTETDADLVIESNLNFSMRIWRWCTESRTRLIFASSAATYGDGSMGFDDQGGIAEFKRLRPLNLYGWSKHAFDLWALRAASRGQQPPYWAGVKFFNVFGPNEYHKGSMMSLVAKNFRNIAEGRPIRLFKSHRDDVAHGEQRRDFIYVWDCAEAMLWMLMHGSTSGIFNLGTGQAHSFNELVAAIGAACGRTPAIKYVDMPKDIRPNYQYFTEADVRKLRSSGYGAAFTPLTQAVNDYVVNFLMRDPYI